MTVEFKKMGSGGGFYHFKSPTTSGFIHRAGGVWDIKSPDNAVIVAYGDTFAEAKQKVIAMFGGK